MPALLPLHDRMKVFDDRQRNGPASARPAVRLRGAPAGPVEQLVGRDDARDGGAGPFIYMCLF
jgi:hypothetical protein